MICWKYNIDNGKSEFYDNYYNVCIKWHMIHKTVQNDFLMYLYQVEKQNKKWQSNKNIGKQWDKYMIMFLKKNGVPKYQFIQFIEKKYPKYNSNCFAKCFDYTNNFFDETEYALQSAMETI